jgi:MFS family permease
MANDSKSADQASSLSPFKHATFTILWVATVISNIGTWMQSAAAGWLMTSLDPSPFIVASVQLASTLPMFLLALPAGAIADIFDRRRLLLGVQVFITIIVAGFGLLVGLDRVTPAVLLWFTALAGAAASLISPAWQAIVPQLVPRAHLMPAVALNSVGVNISRAIGPALAGIIIASLGIAAPFWLNALSNVVVIAALLWWRSATTDAHKLPPEHFGKAMRIGLRYASYNPHLRATMVRAAAFFPLAGAYWALLPLVARDRVAGGPALYGLLLGAIGVGAISGALGLPKLKQWLGADRSAAAGMMGTALATLLFGLARDPATAFVASLLAGVSWIAVLATLNVSAQLALPAWVRGRGLAVYAAVMFGGLTLGSALWGEVATLIGVGAALIVAAACLVIAIPLSWRWKLQTAAGVDMSPSMHWPAPVLVHDVVPDRGPVLVTVDYHIRPVDRAAFLDAMEYVHQLRRRDGAYDWGIFEDAAQEGRYVETFHVDSWLEHLRQHERVTNADRIVQDAAQQFHIDGIPKVTHLLGAVRDPA